jgi:hypothetical protein
MKSVRTVLFSFLILALALAGFGASSAFAQAGLTNLLSGMQVYNQGTATANIVITIYDSTGAVLGSISDTITAANSKTYFPITGGGLPASFSGAAVISSDQPMAAIANTITSDFNYGDSTSSFASGSTSFNLPLVMCNNSGFNTFFSVQNAGSAPANITIQYKPASIGVAGSETATINPGASKTFDQKVGSSTKNCSTLGSGANTAFVGSAVVTSNEPVVASVMEANTTSFKVLLGFNGFTGGSTTVNIPLVMANNSGFYTGLQIQNVGTAATVATVTYSANTAGAFTPTNETCNLAAGASCSLIQNAGQWTGKYIGAATITSSGQPLVAITNQISAGSASMGPFGSASEGFDPNLATTNVTAPLLYSNNSGYYSAIQFQNVGTGACTATMTYGQNTASGETWVPSAENFTLAVGNSKTIIQNGASPANGSVNTFTGHKYIGSGEAAGTGAGCKLVAIVNQLNPTTGDKFFTYDAFNH